MDSKRARNRDTWEAWTHINYRSAFYDVDAFLRGSVPSRRALDELEASLLGEVEGKRLLHLQCHFGMDTLTQARRGAEVVGVDFSHAAIEQARDLADRVGLRERAQFIEHDVLELSLARRFDIVFTSWGVLGWLSNLEQWARVVAAHLRPGGRFVLLEGHPFALVFDDQAPCADGTDTSGTSGTSGASGASGTSKTSGEPTDFARSRHIGRYRFAYPYSAAEPLRIEASGVYSDPEARIESTTFEWQHGLGKVVSALAGAGLVIEKLEEYPFCAWQMFPWMEHHADGLWRLPDPEAQSLPLSYSVRARAPATSG